MNNAYCIFAFTIALLVTASCSTSSVPGSSTATPSKDHALVKLSVVVPKRAASGSTRAFISSGTQSATFSAYFSGQTLTSSTACTDACSASFDVPVGAVGFGVVLYGGSYANEVLGVGNTITTIVDGQNNPVTITVEANDVSATMASSATTVQAGQPTTLTLTATSTDASGETITGSDPYALPITLSLSGTASGAFTLSGTSLTAPTSTVTLTYDGTGSAGQSVVVNPAIVQPFMPTLTPVTISIVQ